MEDLLPWTSQDCGGGNEGKPSPQYPTPQNQDVRTHFIALPSPPLYKCTYTECIQAILHFLVASSSLAKLQPIYPRRKSNRAPLSFVTLSASFSKSLVIFIKNYNYIARFMKAIFFAHMCHIKFAIRLLLKYFIPLLFLVHIKKLLARYFVYCHCSSLKLIFCIVI